MVIFLTVVNLRLRPKGSWILDMPDTGDNWFADEEGYPQYLEAERHLYSWCLMRLGGFTQEAADSEALVRYPYEPPEALFRGMVFHDWPWTWAMSRSIAGIKSCIRCAKWNLKKD